MSPGAISIDAEQDRADQDAVLVALDAMSERRRRISEAQHTIAKLAPRKAAA